MDQPGSFSEFELYKYVGFYPKRAYRFVYRSEGLASAELDIVVVQRNQILLARPVSEEMVNLLWPDGRVFRFKASTLSGLLSKIE